MISGCAATILEYNEAVDREGERLEVKRQQLDEVEKALRQAGYRVEDFGEFLNWRDRRRGVQEEDGEDDDGQGQPVKDYGHAVVLARHFEDRYRWAPHRGTWMRWNSKAWEPIEDERMAKLAADALRGEYASHLAAATDKATVAALIALIRETCVFARITGALSFLKGWKTVLTRVDKWDAQLSALNCGNNAIELVLEEEE